MKKRQVTGALLAAILLFGCFACFGACGKKNDEKDNSYVASDNYLDDNLASDIFD